MFDVSATKRDANIKKYAQYAGIFELTGALGSPICNIFPRHEAEARNHLPPSYMNRSSLLMDEPFVGLDPRASHLLKGFMHEICENGGSIFFSTHVLEVAEKLCNKIAIIKNGKIIRSGPTDEVRGDSSLEDLFLELTEQEDEQA